MIFYYALILMAGTSKHTYKVNILKGGPTVIPTRFLS